MRLPPRLRRVTAATAAAAALLAAGAARASERGPWWAPDHAKLQLAGNIGFLSPGVGWAWRRVDSDVFLGWVPEAIGGEDIFAVTGKLTFAPWTLEGSRWIVRPLTGAAQLTYTPLARASIWPDHGLPPTALRAGFAVGAAAGRRLAGTSVLVYVELVALDVGLVYWVTDRDALGLADVISTALGIRVEL